jgi:hypothetical protein
MFFENRIVTDWRIHEEAAWRAVVRRRPFWESGQSKSQAKA